MTRIAEDKFWVITGSGFIGNDLSWLKIKMDPEEEVTFRDITQEYACLALWGPRARDVLSKVTTDDVSNEAFPYLTAREIDVASARALALRVTYVGELGWELHVPSEFALGVYDALVAAGGDLGYRNVGLGAMNSLRMEKAYRDYGLDVDNTDTPIDVGLSFAVAWDKPGGFIGRDALLRQHDARPRRRLVTFTLDDPEPLLYHNEPIWRDGVLVGKTTSGWYGHTLGRAIALGYVDAGVDGGPGVATTDWLLDGRYEIEIALERFSATPTLRPPYDPSGSRIRG